MNKKTSRKDKALLFLKNNWDYVLFIVAFLLLGSILYTYLHPRTYVNAFNIDTSNDYGATVAQYEKNPYLVMQSFGDEYCVYTNTAELFIKGDSLLLIQHDANALYVKEGVVIIGDTNAKVAFDVNKQLFISQIGVLKWCEINATDKYGFSNKLNSVLVQNIRRAEDVNAGIN